MIYNLETGKEERCELSAKAAKARVNMIIDEPEKVSRLTGELIHQRRTRQQALPDSSAVCKMLDVFLGN